MRIPSTAAKEGATPPPLSGTGAARESSIWYAAGAGDEANAHWRPHMDSSRGLLLNGLETVKVRDKLGFDQNYAVPGQRVSAGSALFDRASDPSRIERLRRLVSAWPRTVPRRTGTSCELLRAAPAQQGVSLHTTSMAVQVLAVCPGTRRVYSTVFRKGSESWTDEYTRLRASGLGFPVASSAAS